MRYDEKLAYEETIHGLRLENKQLRRSLRGAKAKLTENDTITKKQDQTLLHIKAELEFIKQHPFDMVLINGSIENMSRVVQGQTEPFIDGGYVESCKVCDRCCKVVDIAAKLQEELDEAHGILASKDRVIVNLHKTIYDFKTIETKETDRLHEIILDMDVTISDLMDNGRKINGFLDEYRLTVDNRDKTIGEKDKMLEKQGREISGLLCLRDMYDGLSAELSARKEDSVALMKVVGIVKNWDDSTGRAFPTLYKILDLLVDYTDAPEGPPETPIDESNVLKKIRVLVDDWAVNKKGGKQSFFILSEINNMLKSTQHIDETQDITVTFAFLELP